MRKELDKSSIIEGIRQYLDEPHTLHLFNKANKTDDICELKDIAKQAKTMYQTYMHDANYWIDEINNKLKNHDHPQRNDYAN